jgi:hypothetical protein
MCFCGCGLILPLYNAPEMYHHIAEVFCSGVFPQVITRESLLAAQVGPLFPSLVAISSLGHLETFFIYNHHA